MKRRVAAIALTSLALAACGGTSNETSDASVTSVGAPTVPPSEAPTTTGGTTPDPSVDPTSSDDVRAGDGQESAPTDPAVEERPDEDASDVAEGTADTAEPVDEPIDEPAATWPDDGCSADNSPTAATSAEGPAPVIAVRSESADSPLPDLAVRRINCKGGWENLRNELPSDRPLLVWFWAPH